VSTVVLDVFFEATRNYLWGGYMKSMSEGDVLAIDEIRPYIEQELLGFPFGEKTETHSMV